MCTGLWLTLTNRAWFQDKIDYFIVGPWRFCSAQSCTWWCLCCNKWLCWIGVILLAIIVFTVFILLLIFTFILLVLCELLCIFFNIFPQRGIGQPSCFAYRGNSAPTAVTDGPYTGLVGQMIAMSAAGSTDAEADPLSASWTLGDGSTQTGLTISHAYANVGVFNVEVTVSDNRSASSKAQTTATISAIGSGGGPTPPIDE